MNREWECDTVRDSPRLDNRNNHSDGSISSSYDVFQRVRIVEEFVGQVCIGELVFVLPFFNIGRMEN